VSIYPRLICAQKRDEGALQGSEEWEEAQKVLSELSL
jgi:hypothetical protein